jgi:hypothetical protein
VNHIFKVACTFSFPSLPLTSSSNLFESFFESPHLISSPLLSESSILFLFLIISLAGGGLKQTLVKINSRISSFGVEVSSLLLCKEKREEMRRGRKEEERRGERGERVLGSQHHIRPRTFPNLGMMDWFSVH